MKKLFSALIIAGFMIGHGVSQAAVLTIVPSEPTVNLGEQVTVDLNVSGLGDGAAPSFSAFDLDFQFDSTILGFSDITFGDQLSLFSGSLQTFDNSAPGIVNLFELSFDFSFDLDDFQLAEFTLASLTFDSLNTGISPLTLSVLGFGDSFGDPLQVSINTASLEVVPVPGAFPLMLTAIAAFGFLNRRRKNQLSK